jgi:RimJ/RimL family protein N-acetyltransferase
MAKTNIVLETERLLLQEFSLENAEFIVALLNDVSFLRYIGDKNVRNAQDAREYLEAGPIRSYQTHGFGLYLVRMRDSGSAAGMCGLLKRRELNDADLGFAFLPEFRAMGLALEAASAVLDWARQSLSMKRIVAIASPDNHRSIHLLGKLGMRFERATQLGDAAESVHLYALRTGDKSRNDLSSAANE